MTESKTLQDLTIKDNFMFGAVMTNEELCRELLELVLGFPIAKVTVSKEKSFVYHPEYKGVRLDIVAADSQNTHYNVEMQVARRKNPGRRSRYYHSQIDMELLRTGKDYSLLPDSYVIFICDFDPFYQKKYRYTFDSICLENNGISLGDGSHTLFLSTCGENKEEVPEELVKFLNYVKEGPKDTTAVFEGGFVARIQEEIRLIKASREMEEQYMLLEELIREEREEGKAQGKISSILELLSDLGEIPEDIRRAVTEERDPEVLKFYLKQASAANTMEAFRQAAAEKMRG